MKSCKFWVYLKNSLYFLYSKTVQPRIFHNETLFCLSCSPKKLFIPPKTFIPIPIYSFYSYNRYLMDQICHWQIVFCPFLLALKICCQKSVASDGLLHSYFDLLVTHSYSPSTLSNLCQLTKWGDSRFYLYFPTWNKLVFQETLLASTK